MNWEEEARQRLGKLLEFVPAQGRKSVEAQVRAEAEQLARKVGGDRITAHHVTLAFNSSAPKSALERMGRAMEDKLWYEEYFH